MKGAPDAALTEETTVVAGKVVHFFHYDHYTSLVILFFSLLGLVAATALWGVYEQTVHTPPKYFATTPDGRLVAPIPLNKANVSNAALLQWSVEAMTTSYTFNFVNYQNALQSARTYFTQTGYMHYLSELKNSNVIGLTIDKKYVLSATPTSAPILMKEKVIDGLYTWQVQLPMMVIYHSAKDEMRQYLLLTMLIIRVPTSESPEGIAVGGLIVRETKRN